MESGQRRTGTPSPLLGKSAFDSCHPQKPDPAVPAVTVGVQCHAASGAVRSVWDGLPTLARNGAVAEGNVKGALPTSRWAMGAEGLDVLAVVTKH